MTFHFKNKESTLDPIFNESDSLNPVDVRLTTQELTNLCAYFDPQSPKFIKINPKLIEICKMVNPNNTGYNRLVFFVCVVIIRID